MQREFALILRDERDEAGVVRPRTDFREPDLVALHEQFHAENAEAAQRRRDLLRDVAGFLERRRAHGLRLPGFHIVAVDLHMADRIAEMRGRAALPVRRAHGQLRDLEIELDLAFDDDARLLHAARRQAPCPRPSRHRRRSSAATGPCPTTTSPASRSRDSRCRRRWPPAILRATRRKHKATSAASTLPPRAGGCARGSW